MHSSRMRTARPLTIGGGGGLSAQGGVCPGGVFPRGGHLPRGWVSARGCLPRGLSAQGIGGNRLPRGCLLGVSCDLSHHAFDVTCMLLPHQLSVSTSAAAYIV